MGPAMASGTVPFDIECEIGVISPARWVKPVSRGKHPSRGSGPPRRKTSVTNGRVFPTSRPEILHATAKAPRPEGNAAKMPFVARRHAGAPSSSRVRLVPHVIQPVHAGTFVVRSSVQIGLGATLLMPGICEPSSAGSR